MESPTDIVPCRRSSMTFSTLKVVGVPDWGKNLWLGCISTSITKSSVIQVVLFGLRKSAGIVHHVRIRPMIVPLGALEGVLTVVSFAHRLALHFYYSK